MTGTGGGGDVLLFICVGNAVIGVVDISEFLFSSGGVDILLF